MAQPTKEQKLLMLRQQLNSNPSLRDLLIEVGETECNDIYAKTHAVINDVPVLDHKLGQAFGISHFVKLITSAPKSSR